VTLTVETFSRLADSTLVSSRDLSVSADGQSARLGNFIFSAGKTANDAAMKEFREALSREYGVFGEHAFDTVLGSRAQLHKSLRACDVKKTISSLESVKQNRLVNEVNRQLDTNPKILALSDAQETQVRDAIRDAVKGGKAFDLNNCKTHNDVVRQAAMVIDKALESVREAAEADEALGVKNEAEQPEGAKRNANREGLTENTAVDKPLVDNEPAGLKNLKLMFDKNSTSIEDRMKRGLVGVGMRLNRSQTNPVLLHKLKTNGVEPGFIYKNDWSAQDTRSMITDTESEASLRTLAELKAKHPAIALKCEGKPINEQIMKFGRQHPAIMSALSEYMIEKAMGDPQSEIYKAFCNKFPDIDPENWQEADIQKIKMELFAEIRDTVMSVKEGHPDYEKSPVFKHFDDRHIVKLDYNESERIFTKKAAHAGKFRRPERIISGRKFGQIYRLQTATTADKSSAGAVTEALANDLSRLAGVPTQELSIVRGKYSDGHPKIMLQARFAEGYSDMEAGFLKDGQVVPPEGAQTESLGKYKAFFIVTADRDAVGSRGQNKGFANGQFFAIDPGHSLEGNSRYLELDDNFQFKDTFGFSTKPRFKNFSVFDDDTRFAKFQGALSLRDLKNSGKVENLFQSYRNAFNPNEEGISDAEKTLRQQIIRDIDVKQKEFEDSLQKVLNVAGGQFQLYDDLADQGAPVQQKAIETIENLEKLTSPTTWVSPRGEVALNHLQVKPETRVPWNAFVQGENIVYHCDQPLSEAARQNLERIAAVTPGCTLQIDAEGCAKLTIPKAGAERAFDNFSEDNVAKLTHPQEWMAKVSGGDRLAAAREFAAQQPAPAPVRDTSKVASTDTYPLAFNIPENFGVRVNGQMVSFAREHVDGMLRSIPTAEQPQNLAQLQALLAARIERGRDILGAVYSGKGGAYRPTVENIACVTLALHAATRSKGENYSRGGFSVGDPDGHLYKWLDGCKEIYLRTSTHAREYQKMTVDGHMNMPRGIDIPPGKHGMFGPMRTLHYFTLPKAEGQPRRLYLKLETFGIFKSTISKEDEEASRSLGMQTRPERTGDTVESIKHCASLLTVFSRVGGDSRREDFPNELKPHLENAQRELRSLGFANEANQLAEGVVKTNGGIRKMLANLQGILRANPGNGTIAQIANGLTQAARDYAQHMDGAAMDRLGDEVMIEPHELQNQVLQSQPHAPAQ